MNKQQIKYLWSAGILLILIVIIYSILIKKIPKIYPDFGIKIPYGYTIHGIDVSRYQKDIDWKLVSTMRDKGAKINFAIIKATEGCSIADDFYKDNWNDCKKYGIVRGAYHYFKPNIDGKKQAEYFLKHTDFDKGDIAPVLDIEETGGVSNLQLQKNSKLFLKCIENKLNVKPIIYCNVDFYDAHLGDNFDEYPLWAAHYYVQNPNIDRHWNIWQHNDKGHVNGIDAYVDFNTINGSFLDLQKLCLE